MYNQTSLLWENESFLPCYLGIYIPAHNPWASIQYTST